MYRVMYHVFCRWRGFGYFEAPQGLRGPWSAQVTALHNDIGYAVVRWFVGPRLVAVGRAFTLPLLTLVTHYVAATRKAVARAQRF
jgi:hypothetical protein